jgi:DNA-binding NtrC family response regulator
VAETQGMILVVDDEPDLAITCKRLLARRGYEVISVGSRAAAIEALRGTRPALLVSDIRLPDGDGLDLVRAAQKFAPPIPAIVMTGLASPDGREDAMRAGAFAYLAKPFSTQALTALVEQALTVS